MSLLVSSDASTSTAWLKIDFSTVDYLLNYRLQWGKPDYLSILTSALDTHRHEPSEIPRQLDTLDPKIPRKLPDLPADAPPYFTADTPAEYISIIQNDWPYSGRHSTHPGPISHQQIQQPPS
jgi:hypothetical protein